MRNTSKTACLLATVVVALLPTVVSAQQPLNMPPELDYSRAWELHHWMPGRHSHFLNALYDLRTARAYLQAWPGRPDARADQQAAIRQIDAAIREMYRLVPENAQVGTVAVNPAVQGSARYQRVMQLLDRARREANRNEADEWARGQQDIIVAHINTAYQATQQAMNGRW